MLKFKNVHIYCNVKARYTLECYSAKYYKNISQTLQKTRDILFLNNIEHGAPREVSVY